jgi:ribosomal protein L37AE/L43A
MQWFVGLPLNKCAQCGAALFAAEWAEHLSEQQVRNLWSCDACGYRFETTVYFPTQEPVKAASEQVAR